LLEQTRETLNEVFEKLLGKESFTSVKEGTADIQESIKLCGI
jgi:hypothetical protein